MKTKTKISLLAYAMCALGAADIFSKQLGIPDGVGFLLLLGILVLAVVLLRYLKIAKRDREEAERGSPTNPQAKRDELRLRKRRVLQVWGVGVGSCFVMPVWLPYTEPGSQLSFGVICLSALATAVMVSVVVLVGQHKLLFGVTDQDDANDPKSESER